MKIRSPKIDEVKVEPLHERLLKAAVPRAVQLKQNSAAEITRARGGAEHDLCHFLLTNLIYAAHIRLERFRNNDAAVFLLIIL
jgi:hypothetical protein